MVLRIHTLEGKAELCQSIAWLCDEQAASFKVIAYLSFFLSQDDCDRHLFVLAKQLLFLQTCT